MRQIIENTLPSTQTHKIDKSIKKSIVKRSSRCRQFFCITPFAIGNIVRDDNGPHYREGKSVSIQGNRDVRVRWNDGQEINYQEGYVLDMVTTMQL